MLLFPSSEVFLTVASDNILFLASDSGKNGVDGARAGTKRYSLRSRWGKEGDLREVDIPGWAPLFV